ncbi:MAG: hypothetical protein Q4B84_05575, partial [Clostridia bacterium]|nr:hypothetical protein [Clostridia bacterium]
MPLVITAGTVLIGGVASSIINGIRNAKTIEIEEVENIVYKAFKNETNPNKLIDLVENIFKKFKEKFSKENITPDKFIALVDAIYIKLEWKVDTDTRNKLDEKFTELKNKVKESVKSNKFNGEKFTEQLLSCISSNIKQMEERIKIEQEKCAEEKRKQEEKERECKR